MKVMKILGSIALVVIGLIVLVLVVAILVYPPEYV